ncbi:hypothetical protein Pelo_933 [Pelomyxa schiedti]|nr:hypothetical protein Pelo_933 [Pelomyxa schiedti]
MYNHYNHQAIHVTVHPQPTNAPPERPSDQIGPHPTTSQAIPENGRPQPVSNGLGAPQRVVAQKPTVPGKVLPREKVISANNGSSGDRRRVSCSAAVDPRVRLPSVAPRLSAVGIYKAAPTGILQSKVNNGIKLQHSPSKITGLGKSVGKGKVLYGSGRLSRVVVPRSSHLSQHHPPSAVAQPEPPKQQQPHSQPPENSSSNNIARAEPQITHHSHLAPPPPPTGPTTSTTATVSAVSSSAQEKPRVHSHHSNVGARLSTHHNHPPAVKSASPDRRRISSVPPPFVYRNVQPRYNIIPRESQQPVLRTHSSQLPPTQQHIRPTSSTITSQQQPSAALRPPVITPTVTTSATAVSIAPTHHN